jgi:hypothetical protein
VCNPNTEETEAGGLQVQGQTGLHSEFEANIERPFSKKPQNQSQTNKKPHIK